MPINIWCIWTHTHSHLKSYTQHIQSSKFSKLSNARRRTADLLSIPRCSFPATPSLFKKESQITRERVSWYTWPISCCDSHMASPRQQSFVTVLLIMLMQPRSRSFGSQKPTTLTQTLADIKEKREKEWSAQSPLRHMNILSGEFYNSVSLHACGHTLHALVHIFT